MKVSELIEELKKLDAEIDVRIEDTSGRLMYFLISGATKVSVLNINKDGPEIFAKLDATEENTFIACGHYF